MDPADRVLVLRLLQIFEGIVEATETGGERFEVYKHVEIGRIPEALARVDWSKRAVEVAGELLSTLVLAHALPNANHHASISMAEW